MKRILTVGIDGKKVYSESTKIQKSMKGIGTSATKMEKGVAKSTKTFKGLGSVLKTLGLVASAAAFINLGKSVIQLASAAEETRTKFQAVFKELSDSTLTWADSFSDSVGRSKQSVEDWLAGLQDIFVPMGIARDKAADLSKSLVKLGVDVASFNNKLDKDVIRDFQSALVGSTETVRKYGIVLSVNRLMQEAYTQGITKSYNELTEQEKVMLRYQVILKSTTDAQGDAIRTGGSFANQWKRLKGAISDVGVTIGKELLPSITEIVKTLNVAIKDKNSGLNQFIKIMEIAAKFGGKITLDILSDKTTQNLLYMLGGGFATKFLTTRFGKSATEMAKQRGADLLSNKKNLLDQQKYILSKQINLPTANSPSELKKQWKMLDKEAKGVNKSLVKTGKQITYNTNRMKTFTSAAKQAAIAVSFLKVGIIGIGLGLATNFGVNNFAVVHKYIATLIPTLKILWEEMKFGGKVFILFDKMVRETFENIAMSVSQTISKMFTDILEKYITIVNKIQSIPVIGGELSKKLGGDTGKNVAQSLIDKMQPVNGLKIPTYAETHKKYVDYTVKLHEIKAKKILEIEKQLDKDLSYIDILHNTKYAIPEMISKQKLDQEIVGGGFESKASNAMVDFLSKLAEAHFIEQGRLDELSKSYNEKYTPALEIYTTAMKDLNELRKAGSLEKGVFSKASQDLLKTLNDETGLTAERQKLYEDEIAAIDARYEKIQRLNDIREEQNNLIRDEILALKDSIKSPEQKLEDFRQKLLDLQKKSKGTDNEITSEDFAKLMKKAKEDILGLKDIMDELSNSMFTGMKDALVDFIMSWDQGMNKIVNSFAVAMQRIAAEALANSIMSYLLDVGKAAIGSIGLGGGGGGGSGLNIDDMGGQIPDIKSITPEGVYNNNSPKVIVVNTYDNQQLAENLSQPEFQKVFVNQYLSGKESMGVA